jgi:hypothetical protein
MTWRGREVESGAGGGERKRVLGVVRREGERERKRERRKVTGSGGDEGERSYPAV